MPEKTFSQKLDSAITNIIVFGGIYWAVAYYVFIPIGEALHRLLFGVCQ